MEKKHELFFNKLIPFIKKHGYQKTKEKINRYKNTENSFKIEEIDFFVHNLPKYEEKYLDILNKLIQK
jgi:hypothetical protein